MSKNADFVKLTQESTGFWAKLKNLLAVDPNRSSGIPINSKYRRPHPGSISHSYSEPGTFFRRYTHANDGVAIPSGDIAENPYHQRDVRRAYPRTAVFTQSHIAGLLAYGSKEAPQISDGKEGETQLAIVADLNLAKVLDERKVVKSRPPTPNTPCLWELDQTEGFSPDYPVRTFK
ncbi:NADH-ubiquinone oxidoreductase 21 subunit [Neolecta irregularis DAH-3]|uniref:NADH-ubiquinone oxidoreductase 21 subunit n=1 Tax=Neolecta irregularis (strain DAH-3) TaxID=1198029 RepID=A0A1U7LUT1_NEOID|nr:NADH-ubiquinone oxidoreductase 21 subunit [Neolecta irregularis DAH-3]|eukprot:OLL26417.1 NADH-ubiquinone oxidoreductase 21 subunit [Neolecta irregularis DAH-3]